MTSPQETNIFTDQAKWLIEWHNRRSESTSARATALLGFTGVTLALLLQGIRLPGIDPDGWVWTFMLLIAITLLVTAFCCIRALGTIEVTVASSQQMRRWWFHYIEDVNPKSDNYQRNITETFLRGTDLEELSPIDAAKRAADYRSWWFRRATLAMAAEFGFLASLLLTLLIQRQGG